MSYQYILIKRKAVTAELLAKAAETSMDTLRRDNTADPFVVLKFQAAPVEVAPYKKHNRSETKSQMKKTEWLRAGI